MIYWSFILRLWVRDPVNISLSQVSDSELHPSPLPEEILPALPQLPADPAGAAAPASPAPHGGETDVPRPGDSPASSLSVPHPPSASEISSALNTDHLHHLHQVETRENTTIKTLSNKYINHKWRPLHLVMTYLPSLLDGRSSTNAWDIIRRRHTSYIMIFSLYIRLRTESHHSNAGSVSSVERLRRSNSHVESIVWTQS